MSTRPAGRGLCAGVLGLMLLAGVPAPSADAGPAGRDEIQTFTRVEWRDAQGHWQPETLPDGVSGHPAERTYRWRLHFEAPAQQRALYFSGLITRARLSLNGEVLLDTLDRGPELPRPPDWPVLVSVPDSLWLRGENLLELQTRSAPIVSVSRLQVGPWRALHTAQRALLGANVVGPMVAGAVVGTLGLTMLMLWWRRRDALVGTFGLAAVAWGVHNAWSAWPTLLVPQPHNQIFWHVLFTFGVCMVVVFCLRFAEWKMPRMERVLWAMSPACAVVLYAAYGAGVLNPATHWWRLGLIVVISGGVYAMGQAIVRQWDRDGLLLTVTAGLSLAFGVHDWWGVEGENNHVRLVPYASLAFVLVGTRMLVNRFVQAQIALEQLNVGLEQRVAAQNAELRLALETMRSARDAAEAAGRAKSSFLAAASHDLRQPAHALGLYLAALRAQPLGDEQADLAARMHRSLEALDTLFNTLLDVSRIDAGAVVPQWQPVALAPMLQRLADEAAPLAEARGLRMTLRLGAGAAQAVVRSDALLLERILRNLLTNAVRYTHTGGVLLALRRRSGGAGGVWRVEVWDSGVGIAPEHQARVYEEFFQVANPQRDRNAGLGLGLSIVQRLATLLGVPLQLRSRVGRGSCFFVELPAAVPDAASQPVALDAQETAGAAPLAGLRVAVLEDDAEVREALRRLLTQWGCVVQLAGDAQELLDTTPMAGPPQALVLDYRLREGRIGTAEWQRLRTAWGGSPPTLVVTGESDPAVLRELTALGHPWLAKPVPAEHLRAWLSQLAAEPGRRAA